MTSHDAGFRPGDDFSPGAVRSPASCAGGCFLRLFFSVFFLVGVFMFGLMFLMPVMGIMQARNWPATPCTIVSSEVETHRGKGTTYSVRIVFKYEIDGREYQSDRYSFFKVSSGGYKGKRAIVDRHRPGSKAVCYVDPNNPAQAVIQRDFTPGMLLGLLPLIFVAVGLAGMFWAPRLLRMGPRVRADGLPNAPRGDGQSPGFLVAPEMSSGPVTLKAKSSPLGNFIGGIVICLFWNGIVSVFVSIMVHGFLAGKPQWFLTFFLIPFELIGLVLIVVVFQAFLSLFNPRPTVTISAAAIRLGETAELTWQFAGNTGSIQRLSITLKGVEEATYCRGTNTSTSSETFATLPLVDTTNFLDITAGKTPVAVPADTMHSFEAPNNKIIWSIQFKGEISFWPDVDETFSIVILPRG